MKNYFKRVKKDYRHIIMLFLIVLSLALIPLFFKYCAMMELTATALCLSSLSKKT